MALIEKSMLVEHPVDEMLMLVNDVGRYPEFLPWCAGAEILAEDEHSLHAALKIDYKGIRQRFSTRNRFEKPGPGKPGYITMTLVDGPFRKLDGKWCFTPLGEQACKIEFTLGYEFSNRLMDKMIGPVFSQIANSFVDAFVKRAESLYGKN